MIPYSKQNITDEDMRAVSHVLQSDFLTQGPEVKAFEDSLKDRFEVQHAIACSSGTAALHLSCLLYTSPSPRDLSTSRMPSSA